MANNAGLAQGAGAGRWFCPGYVYILKDDTQYKIGCSQNPEERLKAIKRERNKNGIKLVAQFQANEMNSAETAAQAAVKDLGLKKAAQNATDWFINPKRISQKEIIAAVESAVRGK